MIETSFSTGPTVYYRHEVIDGDKPSLMVKALTGSPSWVVIYRGSPNGEEDTYSTVQTHDSATNPSGDTISPGANRYPFKFWRVECVSCSGGTVEVKAWVK